MPEYVNAKLPSRVIAITRGSDRVFSVRRRDPVSGDPVAWGAEVYILVDVSRSVTERVDAVVDGAVATIRMQSDLLDEVRSGSTWRVVMSQPGSPSVETAVMVGVFERNDGK